MVPTGRIAERKMVGLQLVPGVASSFHSRETWQAAPRRAAISR